FEIAQCAVSTESEVEFGVHRFMTHGSVYPQGHSTQIRVRGRSLADLHESHGPFSVLLIDVEGSELEILRTSGDLLARYRLVIIELHVKVLRAEGIEECHRILASVGLERLAQIRSVEAWVRRDPGGSETC